MKASAVRHFYIFAITLLFGGLFLGYHNETNPIFTVAKTDLAGLPGIDLNLAKKSLPRKVDQNVDTKPPADRSESPGTAAEDAMKTVPETTSETKPTKTPEAQPESPPEAKPEPIRLVLPTDNDALFKEPSLFYMHTDRYINGINTKPWQAGSYGFVRNELTIRSGTLHTRFHEGMDIRPVKRDSRNIPLDDVRAMADGTVVYVNTSSAGSDYGKYVVVRHDWPDGAFYSLYAHLAATGVTAAQKVKAGEVLGRLGYTGAGIDRERAHVHVELNFLLSERYSTHFSAGDAHKNYNGINLAGIDVARYLQEHKKNPHLTMKEFIKGEELYFTVRTPTKTKPGILARHPWLGTNLENEDTAQSWEICFARSGIPLSITPSEVNQQSPTVIWVKPINTNHSYMTSGRLSGSGSTAKLSSRGLRYITLISDSF